jgi:hypothetical protein
LKARLLFPNNSWSGKENISQRTSYSSAIFQHSSLIKDIKKAASLSGYTLPVLKASHQTARLLVIPPHLSHSFLKGITPQVSFVSFLPNPCPWTIEFLNLWPSHYLWNHMISYIWGLIVSKEKGKCLLHSWKCPKNSSAGDEVPLFTSLRQETFSPNT